MKNYISFLFIACVLCITADAQDSHFSQYDHSPLTINPALTAVDKNYQIVAHHKEQWRSIKGYRTDELSFEFRFDPTNWIKVKNRTAIYKKKKQKGLALGLSLLSDKAGDGNMKKTAATFSIAYHLLLDENNRISGGFLASSKQSSIDPSGLRFNSQYDYAGVYDQFMQSGENYQTNNISYSDYTAGLCYSFGSDNKYMESNDNKTLKIGIAFDHLSRPEQSYITTIDSKSYMKYTVHGQTLLGVKNTSISVGASAIAMFQGPQKEVTMGMLLKYKMKDESKYTGIKKGMAVSLGCSYRFRDALIPYLQYELARYAIGVSYDVNLSGLKKATTGQGGVEVTLRFFNPAAYLFQKKAGASFN